jgi:ketosteroid isomerase-like protein
MRLNLLLGVSVMSTAFAAAAGAAASAEQSLRDVDAAWVRAAQAHSVDGWMSFYSDDALVLPPNEAAASSPAAVRKSIAELLALPGLRIEWHPVRIETAQGGDLAALAGAYTLSYRDGSGATVSDRGKLLEVWRRQTNGDWKCVMDTWNSDLAAPAVAAAPVAATGATASAADPGPVPLHYEAAIRTWFRHKLVNPAMAQYREIGRPQKGYQRIDGPLVLHPGNEFGWTVTATIDAVSATGADVGWKTYTFLFRGEKIVHVAAPPAEGEMN